MAKEVTFSLEEADLVGLARYQVERSPSLQKRYRFQKYGLAFGLLALAPLTGALWGKTSLPLYFAGLDLPDMVDESAAAWKGPCARPMSASRRRGASVINRRSSPAWKTSFWAHAFSSEPR